LLMIPARWPGYTAKQLDRFTIGLDCQYCGRIEVSTPNMAPIGHGSEFVPAVWEKMKTVFRKLRNRCTWKWFSKRPTTSFRFKICRGFNLLGENGQSMVDMLSGYAKPRLVPYAVRCFRNFLIVPPQAAGLLAREGWTKNKIRNTSGKMPAHRSNTGSARIPKMP